jgi:peptidoglycan hydrolase-like protein with peptidoglycan-binding domain
MDGIFTEQTAEAVRQYQRRYGLLVSGLLDSGTRIHLNLEKSPGEM